MPDPALGAPGADELQAGYVRDFISGIMVRATPEETQSVQVISRRLVEDFGYPKSHITTRPQHRVRRRPSEVKKSYPVDIAVFSDARKHDDDLSIIVECKSENVKTGRKQLESYMELSAAKLGVWFSGRADVEGDTHLYLRKDYLPGGGIHFSEIPTLPRFGQRLEDVGRYLRRDLIVTEQLKSVLRDIRNHLAGNVIGTTRDEQLARQTINILFCKVFDETSKGPDELVDFRAGIDEPASDVRARVLDLFTRVKSRYGDVFEPTDSIELDDESIAYVVGELQSFSVTEAKRDVVGDAFEVFMGPALRGEEGQFFTPRNVVHMIIDIINPGPEEMISIRPAAAAVF